MTIIFSMKNKMLKFTIFFTILIFVVFGIKFTIKKFFEMMYPIKYESIVEEASERYAVEKELIYAIIKCESGFNEEACSHANAYGLMQLTPETFKWLGKMSSSNLSDVGDDIKNPFTNVMYGTYFISFLMRRYDDESIALSAYNAGMNAVDKWINSAKITKDIDSIPYEETREYVKKIKRAKKIYKRLYFK